LTIAEVSKKYELTADTLRYYERIGLIPEVRRTQSGIRNYSEEDCRWVQFVKCMRSAGIAVEPLIEYVALFQQGNTTHGARKQILIDQHEQLRGRLEEMQKTFELLTRKIERYEQWVVPAEEMLKTNPQISE
jgi:DNA-binding transcriptional MerR regulator